MLATFHLSTSDLLQYHPPACPHGSAIKTGEAELWDGLIISVPDISTSFSIAALEVLQHGLTASVYCTKPT